MSLKLMVKDTRRIGELWTRDAPPSDGKIWVWRIRWAQTGILQSPMRWGGGDRNMEDTPKEDGFGVQGMLFRRIVVLIPSYIVFTLSFESSQCHVNIHTNFLWGPSEHICMFNTWKYERLHGGSWTDITLENVENCCRSNWTWPYTSPSLPCCTYPPPRSQFHAALVERYQGYEDDL